MPAQDFIRIDTRARRLLLQGDWNLTHIASIKTAWKKIKHPTGELILDGGDIQKLDSAGVWFITHYLQKLSSQNIRIHLENFSEPHQKLFTWITEHMASHKALPSIKPLGKLEQLGRYTIQQLHETYDFLQFVGEWALESLRIFRHPTHFRVRSVIAMIDQSGFRALPIIALLSFMVGVVVAYQMSLQLRNYGANILIVDFLGLSVLREFGSLLTAIMVAGRTGSAFTAQLGTMKIHQEIDALNTLGVTPHELLILPRMLGLLIALPLLTMWADIFGVMGGMVMANNMLNITWYDFLQRFESQIPLRALLIGLGKAPVFALIIGSIGCFQGMQVQGSADSIGQRTTRSVVLAIFFIIVADAIFSVIFSRFKL